jgi:hypothetical protein
MASSLLRGVSAYRKPPAPAPALVIPAAAAAAAAPAPPAPAAATTAATAAQAEVRGADVAVASDAGEDTVDDSMHARLGGWRQSLVAVGSVSDAVAVEGMKSVCFEAGAYTRPLFGST